jgi:hypothetical protein
VIESLADGSYELDIDAMVVDLGQETVPVISPDYDGSKDRLSHINFKDFIENHWVTDSNQLYLHQWQFPLGSHNARERLCNQNDPMGILGLDLLQFWGNSVNDMKSGSQLSQMDMPFQYIFMGGKNTFRWRKICM